ncbi:MAG: hypothetical protein ACETVQ_03470 [Candidatus Bathyarchaeia archaeon]
MKISPANPVFSSSIRKTGAEPAYQHVDDKQVLTEKAYLNYS